MNQPMKTFFEDRTKEYLIVAADGCYTYKTDINGQTQLAKLDDVREILTTAQNIQPA